MNTVVQNWFDYFVCVYRLFLDVNHAPEKDLVIDCKVRANPRPSISWLKDDQPIEIDERIQQIERSDGVCELIIHKPTVKDSGTYTCTATNSIGSASTSHLVEYQPHQSHRRGTGFIFGTEGDTDANADQGEGMDGASREKSEYKVEETSYSYSRRQPAPTKEELLKAK